MMCFHYNPSKKINFFFTQILGGHCHLRLSFTSLWAFLVYIYVFVSLYWSLLVSLYWSLHVSLCRSCVCLAPAGCLFVYCLVVSQLFVVCLSPLCPPVFYFSVCCLLLVVRVQFAEYLIILFLSSLSAAWLFALCPSVSAYNFSAVCMLSICLLSVCRPSVLCLSACSLCCIFVCFMFSC